MYAVTAEDSPNSDITVQPPREDPPRDRTTRMPVVAMIGGGQLARMTHQAAIELGQTLRVLSAGPDEPAARVSADVVIGEHTDLAALRTVAAGADALTFDHEHVPTEHLDVLVSEGVNVQPPPDALIFAQDKLRMRTRLRELGLPVPDFAEVTSVEDVAEFGTAQNWRIVIKAIRGGYDGRGVWMPDTAQDAAAVVSEQLAAGVPLMVEQRVEMARELSAMVARSPFGQGATWPVVETVQRSGQCAVVIAPAPGLSDDLAAEAEHIALTVASQLGVVGVMAVEMFEKVDGTLSINELAMRPHNSGHWTQDGARTSQFEQHLRAVLDYPLGDCAPLAPVTVMANVLGAPEQPASSMDERVHHLFARMPDAKVHLYDKGERKDRKIGHVNIVGPITGSASSAEHVAEVRERAERAAHWLSHGIWTDGWDPHHG
ncbi:phosphoribosylaminoimidazole carboxylase [Rhodococcus sp. Leaf7]|uniref:5-(carboxyamino)imidazole ribonucleotide synthase n=1 Tax=unclassified Rhodococcus (in: high G+C Gram-positive bacteria) TaxID=192944 RepID=UPI0006F6A23C|nr:phosphoribosylaminoimidazole carboxylase [Rhodococcus sp. Leaf7]KQU41816.1 phosphoribosylaminoimidazole carboxylase [Rhodococcus sp. Leaf247]